MHPHPGVFLKPDRDIALVSNRRTRIQYGAPCVDTVMVTMLCLFGCLPAGHGVAYRMWDSVGFPESPQFPASANGDFMETLCGQPAHMMARVTVRASRFAPLWQRTGPVSCEQGQLMLGGFRREVRCNRCVGWSNTG
jgi:hypothetical protein